MAAKAKSGPGSMVAKQYLFWAVFALGVILFNLLFAIRPKTAMPPPVKTVPEDFFSHSDWAPANYVAQGRYLEYLLGSVVVTSSEELFVPGPVFFEGTSRLTQKIVKGPPPTFEEGYLLADSPMSITLFQDGSETDCQPGSFSPSEVRLSRCEVEVVVGTASLESRGVVELVQVQSEGKSVFLVDRTLLNLEQTTAETDP